MCADCWGVKDLEAVRVRPRQTPLFLFAWDEPGDLLLVLAAVAAAIGVVLYLVAGWTFA